MKTNYNFLDKCPTANDYETHLNSTGSSDFNEAFKLHLKSCELCNQSVQGYKNAGLTSISESLQSTSKTFKKNTNTPTRVLFKTVGYAASIIILIGISAAYFSHNNKHKSNQRENNFDYTMLIENNSTKSKTLAKKTNDHFIYIGTCDKIAYNDQFLSSRELIENLKNQKNINLITVEVAAGDYNCASVIINSIKLENLAPIITISRGTKKLTPWGGGLGG